MKEKPLYKQIIDDICADIASGKLRPGDRVPSERELMHKYMVSQMTTKNALNELAEKSVIHRIKGKGSFVNEHRALQQLGLVSSRGNSPHKIMGLILPMMKTRIDQELLDNIEYYSRKSGYNLVLKISRESQKNETNAIRELISLGAEGIIIFPTENELYNGEILKLAVDDFPLVFVDRYLQGINACSITTDNARITKEAVVDMRNKGAKSIVFISPDSNNSVTKDRLAGFYNGFSENRNDLSQAYQLMIDLDVQEAEDKETIIREFIASNPDIDGFFCVNNELATRLLSVLEKHFPEMLNTRLLYAFDASSLPYFTYIYQDTKKISELAVKHLIDLIKGQGVRDQIAIPAQLIRPG